ncbi:MAG: hypothetical protein IJ154_07360 [Bacteroidales bacterium]|nr:hypothetical protein [Bacteroidales bacterium]
MNTIQDLTDQLYREGVEKGNLEADRIVAAAREKEAAILSEARKTADDILSAAQKQAEELDKNTKAELRLFAGQSLEALKSEVVNLLTDKVVTDSINEATAAKDFMPDLLLNFVKNWAGKGELVIETADDKALTDYFRAKAADVLKNGLVIKQVNGLPTDFVLSPADGSYKIQLGKQDFIEYFKEFLRPKLVEMLF